MVVAFVAQGQYREAQAFQPRCTLAHEQAVELGRGVWRIPLALRARNQHQAALLAQTGELVLGDVHRRAMNSGLAGRRRELLGHFGGVAGLGREKNAQVRRAIERGRGRLRALLDLT
jgi:hypothetical protein